MFKHVSAVLTWIGRHFKGLLFVLILIVLLWPKGMEPHQANLAMIELNGPIFNADSVLHRIDEVRRDTAIKGVLFRVNSPGGAVAPSIEIAYAIRELSQTKPVVAYASGLMASGGYYASVYANRIVANPGAIVGSIGVILRSADIHELMDKIGIAPQVVKQGTYKEAGTPTRKWTPQERAELERLVADGYEIFVQDVVKARHLDRNETKRFADAHIFSAKRAKEVGLIDEVATLARAKDLTQTLAGIKQPVWQRQSRIESLWEEFRSNVAWHIESTYGMLQSLWRP